jgi:hypothetical protein
MERGMMPPQLEQATKVLSYASLIVAHKLSVAEYRADTRDGLVIFIDHINHGWELSTLFLRVDNGAWRSLSREVQT